MPLWAWLGVVRSARKAGKKPTEDLYEAIHTVIRIAIASFGINKQATLFDLRRHIQKLLHLG